MANVQRQIRTRPLSIFLLRKSVKASRGAIEQPDDYHTLPVRLGRATARLFVKTSPIHKPAWASFFVDEIDLSGLPLRSASSSAVLVVRAGGRLFAVAFGYGRHILRPGCWDETFGLRVTLNSINPESIRSIDRKSFDSISRHTREEASREGSIEQFGLNVDQDLLRGVVGTPADEALGKRLAGMDALTATIAITLRDLPQQLEVYLGKYRKRTYRKRFPWVEQIGEIRDRRKAAELDGLLTDRLAVRELDGAWLAVPEPIDWSEVGGFQYSLSTGTETFPDIHLSTFLDSLRRPEELNPDQLRRKPVFCLGPDGLQPRRKWTAYQCMYAELNHQGNLFLLTGGHWYRIAPGFVTRVNTDISTLPRCSVPLPPYEHGSEAEYNKAVSRSDRHRFALMDAKNIPYGGGASRIELCDLLTTSRVMIHVKRYGGSSVLSHLFAQGVVAATLFLQDSEFRKAANKYLPGAHKLGNPARRPTARRYEIAFAIVSRSSHELRLPFFSKVNLRTARQTLSGLGYRVSLSKIDSQ